MVEFADYLLRIVPGLLIFGVVYALLADKKTIAIKILLLIFGFILLRDAMTPLGFWEFGLANGLIPWIRFTDDMAILSLMGALLLGIVLGLVCMNRSMKQYLCWGPLNGRTILWGVVGAAAITFPYIAVVSLLSIPLSERGGEVAYAVLPVLFVMIVVGNLLEEILFRGYLQGYFEQIYTPVRAAVLSAFIFALGHTFLATTVTDIGPVVLLFTLYEGAVCAFLRLKHGIWPAAIAHGVAIFVLTCGLV
ncbi:MAG TPA: CPBP family intramembrane glutamic endopeptidase [Verrucomicrobiae bacterium]|nr:CPBP family intramembrane glutamic endopeptidase [Verrucomicrobiae bacterium]